ncbi:hypothetical protein [Azospirillum aestuarii]|nr:hypothetical protein [Azospirillum aestuarii]
MEHARLFLYGGLRATDPASRAAAFCRKQPTEPDQQDMESAALSDQHHRRLERRVDRIQEKLPDTLARMLAWLREPRATWVRAPAGFLLILGGLFSFLPVLGIWMLPLGLVLLAYDVPFLRPPINRALVRGERRWKEWKRRRRAASSSS